jgi:LytS/YehU family sensor histidine kinase
MRRNVARIQAQNRIDLQITQLKSTALRAQMNPHFVFNCLNAIQECVVTGKEDEAYTYLSKFSRLLRLILEYSDRSEISLQQEMEILDLYISLEKLRFKESFAYTLSADDEIEAEQTFIPPMLIQPHIENAIWHGLRHLQGEKQLSVEIQEHADYIQVIVTDNGIGRKKAMELKSSRIGSGQGHTSKGLAISAQRLDLLQKQFPATSMDIEDLYVNGVAAGTKVTLRLPIMMSGK